MLCAFARTIGVVSLADHHTTVSVAVGKSADVDTSRIFFKPPSFSVLPHLLLQRFSTPSIFFPSSASIPACWT